MSRANLEIAVVKYTGTGVAAHKSDWTTLSPMFALLKGAGTDAAMSTSRMLGRSSYPGNTTSALSNVITQIGDGGVVLGTSAAVNGAASTYYGLVIAARGSEAAYVGRYRGKGVAGNIQDGHFPNAPEIVIAQCSTNAINGAAMRTASLTTAFSLLLGAANTVNTMFTGLLSDGVSVGTSSVVNSASYTYDYLSLRSVPGAIAHGVYAGTGVAQSVSGLGFSPDFVLVKAASQTTPTHAVIATRDMIADGAYGMRINTGSGLTDSVLSMDDDGFGVGAAADVNESGRNYYWIAFKAGEYFVDLNRTAA